jgi:glycosyltransferase involved in cell wall biosynthesis
MRPVHGRFDKIYNVIEGVLGRLGNTIVVSADEEMFARERLRIPESRVHLIQNGVDLDAFSPASPEIKRRLREKLGVPTETLILGCIGRSSEQKDPVTLYRAFVQAAAQRPVALLHVGKGELDAVLDQIVRETGIGDRVFRFGYTSTPADFYRAIDGFILTSRYEGFSLALLEAMAANLPLIVSNAPGNRDLLRQPLSHQWSAEVGDVDGFARHIVAWHDQMRGGTTETINHRQFAQEHFDVQERFDAVLRLYRRLMGTKQPADADGKLKPSARPS